MIQVGENLFIQDDHFRMICEHLFDDIQIKFWGKKIIDCNTEEYKSGLESYLNSLGFVDCITN